MGTSVEAPGQPKGQALQLTCVQKRLGVNTESFQKSDYTHGLTSLSDCQACMAGQRLRSGRGNCLHRHCFVFRPPLPASLAVGSARCLGPCFRLRRPLSPRSRAWDTGSVLESRCRCFPWERLGTWAHSGHFLQSRAVVTCRDLPI